MPIIGRPEGHVGLHATFRDSPIPGFKAARFSEAIPGGNFGIGASKHVNTLTRDGVSVHAHAQSTPVDDYYSVFVNTPDDESQAALLCVDVKHEGSFEGIAARARATVEYFQQTGLLTAINAEDLATIKKIIHFRIQNANKPEQALAEAKALLQPTLELIKKLEMAKEIQPMPLPNDIVSASSEEKEAIGFSHMLSTFYTVAHWYMQEVSKWHEKMLAEQPQN